jgi:hypothetical protein
MAVPKHRSTRVSRPSRTGAWQHNRPPIMRSISPSIGDWAKRRFSIAAREPACATDPKSTFRKRTHHKAAATAQTAQVKAAWEPKTRAILALMRLNFLSASAGSARVTAANWALAANTSIAVAARNKLANRCDVDFVCHRKSHFHLLAPADGVLQKF